MAAHAGALAAALARMVAGLTVGRKKYAAVDTDMRALATDAEALGARLAALVHEDADAYAAVSAAYKLPGDAGVAAAGRATAIQAALVEAARVPLETARACTAVARLAVTCASKGNTNAVRTNGEPCRAPGSPSRGGALPDSPRPAR